MLNAADYGVPQKREPVCIVGFRSDLNIKWSFPKATHPQDALLWDQWVTGEYWHRLDVPESDRPKLKDAQEKGSVQLQKNMAYFKSVKQLKAYPGHTGSPIDEPSKTLKAGDHGVPGGENMIRFNDASIRYFTVREAARIQTFPDDYHISGVWSECMRQVGNAVPVTLAEVVANSVYQTLPPTRARHSCADI